MRVYVETNFVLELALEQTGHEACARLLELAESRDMELALPAFSIFEAHYSLAGKSKGIQRVARAMGEELKQHLNRTGDFAAIDKASDDLLGTLTRRLNRAEARLEDLRARLLLVADTLTLGPSQLELASRSESPMSDLGFADAIVYATIKSDPKFGQGPSCFVNLNKKDFDSVELKGDLRAHGCELKLSFEGALHYVEAQLRREPRDPGPAQREDPL